MGKGAPEIKLLDSRARVVHAVVENLLAVQHVELLADLAVADVHGDH